MLEIRNVTKVYRSKTGEEVRALDNVSITFPESGMVFILGKSGSGKSTLLNVMGGLDSYDSGEFIIKGKSSNDFVGSDFDAYRNTFIGFIFQEYNVLDDFTVGANIGLALELQGKKATEEKINEILESVDLLNYAQRKPNELSGGQKQRVAIARALVKEPQIIMADEPTGALDSNTGKQIFDTLKALSKEKLVLIVSHDRDFAERYADRIIEMADGQVIEDVTKHEHHAEKISDGVHRINENILRIESGYKLTSADLEMINAYLAKSHGDVLLSGDGRVNDELRSAAGISKDGSTTVFEGTSPERDIKTKKYERDETKFIRSKLPMKNAVKMGASGLKHKKFRLFMTVLLSFISFAMFGLADTMAAYDKVNAATESMIRANIQHASVQLGVRSESWSEGEMKSYWYNNEAMNDADIAALCERTGLKFTPVFTGSMYSNGGFSITKMYAGSFNNDSQVYKGKLTGLVNLTADQLPGAGLSMMAGSLPVAKNEIAITDLILKSFQEYGFKDAETGTKIDADKVTAEALIGKSLSFATQNYGGNGDPTFTIVGVVNTQFDFARYQSFLPSDEPDTGAPKDANLVDMVLAEELNGVLSYGFHALGFAHNDAILDLAKNTVYQHSSFGTHMNGWRNSSYIVYQAAEDDGESNDKEMLHQNSINMLAGSDAIDKLGGKITWLGDAKTTLAADEVIIPMNLFEQMIPRQLTISEEIVKTMVNGLYSSDPSAPTDYWSQTDASYSFYQRWLQAANIACPGVFGEQEVRVHMFQLFTKGYFGIPANVLTDDILMNPYFADHTSMSWFLERTLGQMTAENPVVENFSEYYIIWNCYYAADYIRNSMWNDEAFKSYVESEFDYTIPEDENLRRLNLFGYYTSYCSQNNYADNTFSYEEANASMSRARIALSGTTSLDGVVLKRVAMNYELQSQTTLKEYTVKVVGVYDANGTDQAIINDTILADYRAWYEAEVTAEGGYITKEAEHDAGIWAFAVAPMGTDPALVRKLVEMSYDETGDLNFSLQNAVMNTLGMFNEIIEVCAQVFVYVGLGLALFSSFLLMNFIATSISYKKRDIGILRAVGARSSDVFKIFFSESFIIAMINFVLALAATGTTVYFLNNWMETQGINVQLLTFGVRQVALMLGVSLLVAVLSSFLPVRSIARKKPVDAIKDR